MNFKKLFKLKIKFITFLKKAYKYIKKYKIPINKIKYLYSILMFGLFVYFVMYLIYEPIRNISTLLGIDLGTIKSWFVLVTFIFGFGLFARKMVLKHTTLRGKIYNLFNKKINTYVLLSFYLITLFIVISLSVFPDFFPHKVPVKNAYLSYYPSEETDKILNDTLLFSTTNFTGIYCESVLGYHDFVAEDKLRCFLNMSYKQKSPYVLDRVLVNGYTVNGLQVNNFQTSFGYKTSVYPFEIYLNDTSYSFFYTSFIFKNSSNNEVELFNFQLREKLLTREEYNTKENQKVPILLGILSIAIFSILAGVKNLRDLIEYNK